VSLKSNTVGRLTPLRIRERSCIAIA
jgi:hypothetical protein